MQHGHYVSQDDFLNISSKVNLHNMRCDRFVSILKVGTVTLSRYILLSC